MSVPTTSWDENSPAGSDAINLGDNKIREMKTQIREVMDVDHDFPSSGSAADVGQHKKVTLQEQANLGTGAVGTTILGSQTVAGRGELVYTNEDDTDIQLTRGAYMGSESTNIAANTIGAAALYLASVNIFEKIYPIGIVITLGVSTNPATLFGIGTWTAIAGRVIVGIDAGQTEFDTLDETGGAKTHTLTLGEVPTTVLKNTGGVVGNGGSGVVDAGSNSGGGGAHNNLQPYIVKYVWQRTA